MKPHYRIRRVKTHSGSTAIQVGFYKGKNFKLEKHIGSHKEPRKISELVLVANEYIRSHSLQQELNFNPQSEEILFKRGLVVKEARLDELFDCLETIYSKIGFSAIKNDTLKHFSLIRLVEPASKVKSIILLKKYFDINYKKTTAFRQLEKLIDLKEEVSEIAISYAKKYLGFNFSLVFYDVTTLYFETFKEDENSIRKAGFSKDNKPNQPQILIGLVVNETGFPVYYDIFAGNTFEGKTIVPVLISLKEKHHIDRFTVIADAGMLSEANLKELEENNISYVVGARIGNLNSKEISAIADELNQTNGKIIRQGSTLYEYSTKRALKDRSDNDRYIKKANQLLKNPAKTLKRSKFLMDTGTKQLKLNQKLILKHRLLEGIKGYRTDITDLSETTLIARYKDLWKIEQSFRIAKNDLEARPIYHHKEISIKYHILIVFVALCMARVIEIERQESVKKVIADLKDRWTVKLVDEISGNSVNVVIDKKPH